MTTAPFAPKYQTEIYLEYQSVDRFLFRAADLEDLDDILSPETREREGRCHIYLIAKRPRLSIVPTSLRRRGPDLRLQVEYRREGKTTRRPVVLPAQDLAEPGETLEVSPYPHREILTKGPDGSLIGTTLLANMAHVLGLPADASHLEVVYVGKGMRRSARDRLNAHSTLQAILAKAGSDDPDAEIFLVVHAFEPKKQAVTFPSDCTAEIGGEAARIRLEAATSIKLAHKDQVALIEAACISYFQTSRYNTHYLNFPDTETDALRLIRGGDFAAILVQLDHTNIGNLAVFSQAVPPRVTHDIVIDFRRRDGRWSFLAQGRPGGDVDREESWSGGGRVAKRSARLRNLVARVLRI